ncbi:MBL fold metallo-hydrolase [Neisseria sp. Ec49-e6-T10]|uniref:MBL fold metallo-hydrolase n=1 Tax=Neisseria sp. Ec49-e6-T10 TaxID=3140744 RepID=UPI003EB6C223
MAVVLYEDSEHKCVAFTDLVEGEGVQANQFAIVHQGHGMLLDPGGNLVYKQLFAQISDYFAPSNMQYVFASHADPDIISCLNGLLLMTDAKVLIAQEWERFLPHFCQKGISAGRLVSIPAQGLNISLQGLELKVLPAHYLHTVGNFHIYDPISKILFSGDVGASFVDNDVAATTVTNVSEHVNNHGVIEFHQRYMTSNKACKLWVQMIRSLDVEWIVPQHGSSYKGKETVEAFLGWFENLQCGIDLL